MKNWILGVAALLAVNGLQSCSGVRSANGPSGSVNTGYGPASNISAGRTDAGTGSDQQMPQHTTDTLGGGTVTDRDSLSRKVDGAAGVDKARAFVMAATSAGHTATGLSEFALRSAQNTNVKAFASLVLDNQQKASADLKALASAKNFALDAKATDSARNEKVRELTTVTGEEFETRYVQAMTALQDQAVKLYEEGTSSKDAAVKDYAKKYLSTMKMQQKALSAFTDKH